MLTETHRDAYRHAGALRGITRWAPWRFRSSDDVLSVHPGDGVRGVVCEALANATRHSHATTVTVKACCAGDRLHLTVGDDGVGGAAATPGSGLIGLEDRAEALGETLTVTSPPGEGTKLAVDLPLAPAAP